MEHMGMRWEAVAGRLYAGRWMVGVICDGLPCDRFGSRTAQAIADAHNAALDAVATATPAPDPAATRRAELLALAGHALGGQTLSSNTHTAATVAGRLAVTAARAALAELDQQEAQS